MLNTDTSLVTEYKQGFMKYTENNSKILMCQDSKHINQAPTQGSDNPHLHREVRHTERGFPSPVRSWWWEVQIPQTKCSWFSHPSSTILIAMRFPVDINLLNDYLRSQSILPKLKNVRDSRGLRGVESWGKAWVWNYLTEVAARSSAGPQTALASRPYVCLFVFSTKNGCLED